MKGLLAISKAWSFNRRISYWFFWIYEKELLFFDVVDIKYGKIGSIKSLSTFRLAEIC